VKTETCWPRLKKPEEEKLTHSEPPPEFTKSAPPPLTKP
jgi:hypothetical protein